MDIIIFVTMFLMISFWAYCNLFYAINTLPYRFGYACFAQIQWLVVGINLVRLFGWLNGLIALFFIVIFGAVLITNFTTKHIYFYIFKDDPLLPLVLFSTLVWINVALTAIVIVF